MYILVNPLLGGLLNRKKVIMSELNEQIQQIVGRRIVRAEWVGNLSIDDNEGYLLTFDDGSSVLFSWYQAYDCVGVLHEIHAAQHSVQRTGLGQCEEEGCKKPAVVGYCEDHM